MFCDERLENQNFHFELHDELDGIEDESEMDSEKKIEMNFSEDERPNIVDRRPMPLRRRLRRLGIF